jgi:hypothetical protein
MPKLVTADQQARSDRIAEQVRREKDALSALDRAAGRLAAAETRRDEIVAQAESTVAEARDAYSRALAGYARQAGADRAAFMLDLDERELRRLIRESRAQ